MVTSYLPAMLGRMAVAWPWLGRGSAVPWPWLGRGSAVAWPWLGRGSAVARPWLGRGSAVARPWLGRGSAVVWPWLGRGSAVAWPWLGRGSAVAWPWLGRGSAVARPWLGRGSAVVWPWLGRGLAMTNSILAFLLLVPPPRRSPYPPSTNFSPGSKHLLPFFSSLFHLWQNDSLPVVYDASFFLWYPRLKYSLSLSGRSFSKISSLLKLLIIFHRICSDVRGQEKKMFRLVGQRF